MWEYKDAESTPLAVDDRVRIWTPADHNEPFVYGTVISFREPEQDEGISHPAYVTVKWDDSSGEEFFGDPHIRASSNPYYTSWFFDDLIKVTVEPH